MSNAESFLRFYLLATNLKNTLRQGPIYWNVQAERFESVAEHIYDTCILAISIYSQFRINIDIEKVLMMLIIHELEEIVIGDITPIDKVTDEEKKEMGKKAVLSVLEGFKDKEEIINLTNEFNERKTPEAAFAHLCDKLDFDIQMKLYSDKGKIPFEPDNNNPIYNDERIKKMIEDGATCANDIFYNYDRQNYMESPLFISLFGYIQTVNLKELLDKYLNDLK